ncbi:hypothetical protein [Pedobacter sp. L105]|uniref:hypothetical protein n=1 Tax=Pedobacter sp. L105 TaxID=1641871 RepID=UPI00131D7AD3|nr:hypothetical protein [Pedobacter sp. L105]
MLKASTYQKIPKQVLFKLALSIVLWIASAVILLHGKNWETIKGTSFIILMTGIMVFTNVYNAIKKYAKDDSAIK